MEQTRGNFNVNSGQPATPPSPAGKKGLGLRKKGDWVGLRYMFVILVSAAVILLVTVLLFLALGSDNNSGEDKLVKKDQYQAVFLNNGQVYFGKISSLNSSTLVVNDVFYIEAQAAQQQQSNNNYTLRKLGASELHKPEDSMIINRDQVTFWENIKEDGRVVQAIKQYKQNPDAANQVQNTGTGDQTPTTNQTTPTANQNGTGTTQNTNQ